MAAQQIRNDSATLLSTRVHDVERAIYYVEESYAGVVLADFHEGLSRCLDTQEQLILCRHWLEMYRKVRTKWK